MSAGRLVVAADASLIHYLVLIGEGALLPRVFGNVLIPDAVRAELLRREAPQIVRNFATNPLGWLQVHSNPPIDPDDPVLLRLDHGEQAALALAAMVRADLLLIDDRAGVAAARRRGFALRSPERWACSISPPGEALSIWRPSLRACGDELSLPSGNAGCAACATCFQGVVARSSA